MKADISDFQFINYYLNTYRWYLTVTIITMRMWEDIVVVCSEVLLHSDDWNVVHKLVQNYLSQEGTHVM